LCAEGTFRRCICTEGVSAEAEEITVSELIDVSKETSSAICCVVLYLANSNQSTVPLLVSISSSGVV